MKTVNEIKAATAALPAREQFELWRWLTQSDPIRRIELDELHRALEQGIAQADRGELHEGAEVFADLKQRAAVRRGK